VHDDTQIGGAHDRFPTTRQTAVQAAGSNDPGECRRGFDALVGAYWKPVYKYLRLKWREDNEGAKDLTQGFFARAMEKGYFRGYDPAKASFRTYLRTCVDGYVANERQAAHRIRRGGDVELVALDFEAAEGELREHPVADGVSMEEYLRREWVRSLFGLAVERLQALCRERDKTVHFRLFERYDLDEEETSYEELARELSLPVTQVTNYLAWTRREFRRLVLEELREVSGSEEEFRREARALLGVNGR
jgi:RNA polymerase sigma factor (sigma-70 family)